MDRPPGVIYASTSMSCGGSRITLGTGNDQGTCKATKNSSGVVIEQTCDDGNGNSSVASCHNGIAACDSTSGSGKCDMF